MAKSKLIVKPHQPRKAGALWVAICAAAVGTAYLLYEYGRYRGGFDGRAVARERQALTSQVADLKQRNDELQEKIATLETSKIVDREAYARVEGTLADLQQRIATQQEELAFYRGIVAPPDGVRGLQIQELKVEPGSHDSEYRLRLVLVQAAARRDRRVSGVVNLSIEGARDGAPVRYNLAELIPGDAQSSKLGFSFRYYQDFERDFVLPNGFVPNRVNVEVNPNGRSAKAIRQAFDWAVQSS